MSKPLNSYPWYPSDWRGSETRLSMSMEERGIYRELLDHCWMEGSLPTNAKVLAGIAGASAQEWKRSSGAALSKFVERNGRYFHPKIELRRPDILMLAERRAEKSKKAAEERWEKQRENDHSGDAPSNAPSIPKKMLVACPTDAQAMLGSCSSDAFPFPSHSPPLLDGEESTSSLQALSEEVLDDPPPLAAEVAKILADWQEVRPQLCPPDQPLVFKITMLMKLAGMSPDDLAALLRSKREAIRKAESWGLVVRIVEAACQPPDPDPPRTTPGPKPRVSTIASGSHFGMARPGKLTSLMDFAIAA